MTPTFALGVPTTPWIDARVASMARLREQLGVAHGNEPLCLETYREFTDREPNHAWSGKLWEFGAQSGATHLVQLQDDAIVAPNFWRALSALVTAHPSRVICLEAVHPAGKALARSGKHVYTLADGLIGVGYVIPVRSLGNPAKLGDCSCGDKTGECLTSWRDRLKRGAVEAITEDTLLATWCVATGRRILCPCPTIIDHDVTIASTYGNDQHAHRQPSVLWSDGDVCGWELADLEDPAFWQPDETPTHLGRFYASVQHGAVAWTNDFTPEDAKRIDADVCPHQHTRFFR